MLRSSQLSVLLLLVLGCSTSPNEAGSGGTGTGTGAAGSAASGGSLASGGRAASGGGSSGGAAAGGGGHAAGTAAVGGLTSAGGSGGTGGTPSEPLGESCEPRSGYRNLFVELLQKSESAVNDKLSAAFEHFFHGGAQQQIYYESGADEAYVLDVNNDDVRSEGMSYGMMVAVQLDKQDEFDRLWKWAKTHTQQANGYFAWQATASGQVRSTASAPDGEEYFATALIFAAHRWGTGKHDYATDARKLLDALHGNGAFNDSPPVVKFLTSVDYSDPSYVLPAFYEIWACFDEKNRSFWRSAVTSGRSLLRAAAHEETGLAPYLSNFDGSPHARGPNFNSDSWRVVGNIMMDHHWFQADPWQVTFADTYAKFFEQAWAQNANAYEFGLSGNVLQSSSGGPPRGLISMNALVAFAAPEALAKPDLQQLWDLAPPDGQYRYYDGMLYLFALLQASGNYRIY